MVCCFFKWGNYCLFPLGFFFLMRQLLFEQTAQRKASIFHMIFMLIHVCTLIVSLAMFFGHLFPEKQIEEQAMMEQTVHSWRIWDDL